MACIRVKGLEKVKYM